MSEHPEKLRSNTYWSAWPDKLEALLGFACRCGVSIPPASRVVEYAKLILAHRDELRAGDLQAKRAFAKATGEMHYLAIAARHLDPTIPGVVEALQNALKGTVWGPDDANRLPRSKQAELLVGGVLASAGFRITSLGDKMGIDIESVAGEEEWHVEVKRVVSDDQVERRIREANRGLRALRTMGIAFVDLSALLTASYPDPRDLGAESARDLLEAWQMPYGDIVLAGEKKRPFDSLSTVVLFALGSFLEPGAPAVIGHRKGKPIIQHGVLHWLAFQTILLGAETSVRRSHANRFLQLFERRRILSTRN